jgi:hypothetical protein
MAGPIGQKIDFHITDKMLLRQLFTGSDAIFDCGTIPRCIVPRGDDVDGVVPVFIFDDAILKLPDCGGPIVQFMLGLTG